MKNLNRDIKNATIYFYIKSINVKQKKYNFIERNFQNVVII